MQTHVTLSIDKQIYDTANLFANKKGMSLNRMLEFYLKSIVQNATFIEAPPIKEKDIVNKWTDLENFLSENRFDLPDNYKFNRDELYDR